MKIDAKLVKKLREITNSGMMECKKSLVESGGDIKQAIENMRKSGKAKAEKKSSRIAAEGLVLIKQENNKAIIIEINTETDFVARDKGFLNFAHNVANLALSNLVYEVDKIKLLKLDNDTTVEQAQTDLIAKIGEKIDIRRAKLLSGSKLGIYNHNGRIGVVVSLDEGSEDVAKDVAMHIAAINPLVLDEDSFPKDLYEKEKSIVKVQLDGINKPEHILEKIIEGKLKKFVAGHVLLLQDFVKDSNLTVGKWLQDRKAKVSSFMRFELGDGIRKLDSNFAEEVFSQIKDNQ